MFQNVHKKRSNHFKLKKRLIKILKTVFDFPVTYSDR